MSNNEQFLHKEKKGLENNAEMEWFTRFENMPGIFDNYTTDELIDFKSKMLNDLKKKINKID